MRKFRGVEDHAESTSKALHNRNRQAAAAAFYTKGHTWSSKQELWEVQCSCALIAVAETVPG